MSDVSLWSTYAIFMFIEQMLWWNKIKDNSHIFQAHTLGSYLGHKVWKRRGACSWQRGHCCVSVHAEVTCEETAWFMNKILLAVKLMIISFTASAANFLQIFLLISCNILVILRWTICWCNLSSMSWLWPGASSRRTFPLYSEPFIKDRAPHRLSKVDPIHTLEECHFSCLYVGSHSLGHNPQLVMIGDIGLIGLLCY